LAKEFTFTPFYITKIPFAMQHIYYSATVIWAQVDMNQHMRHSAYADVAAQARLAALESFGLTLLLFKQYGIGPILFREELTYLRELHLNDSLHVSCELARSRADGSRWTIRHELFRGDGTKAAIVVVDGAWLDLRQRKTTAPPDELMRRFLQVPKTADYQQID
jgi:acyl-CoA thioester hydrolase